MSTDNYVASDPPTKEDWEHLYERAEVNKRRGRRGVVLGVISLVLAVAVLFAGAAIYLSQRDVPAVLDKQTLSLSKLTEIVEQLQVANEQRKADAKDQSIALAIVVEGIAGGFATPPAPDPGRKKAVAVLCDLAKQFRAAAGDNDPPPCPAS